MQLTFFDEQKETGLTHKTTAPFLFYFCRQCGNKIIPAIAENAFCCQKHKKEYMSWWDNYIMPEYLTKKYPGEVRK